ncbi:MAG: hypothetical protein KAR47_04840 [Planctomycetes bacterium]|nr:hypothetical protein [Planctomycetota bacterium]
MVGNRDIGISELLVFGAPKKKVFEDDCFSRARGGGDIMPGVGLSVLTDRIKAFDVSIHYISLRFEKSAQVRVVLGAGPNLSVSGDEFIISGTEGLLWIPGPPVARDCDEHGGIVNERRLAFEDESSPNDRCLTLRGAGQSRIDFVAVVFAGDAGKFIDELNRPVACESQAVGKYSWFSYRRVNDIWNYFIAGNIFRICRNREGTRVWSSQQVANTIYGHMTFLQEKTQKRLYTVLKEVIAYSVMLDLSDDGRWQHGQWTDVMENHMRYQVDGIYILLAHYEETKRDIFLEKAQLAVAFLVSVVDVLDDDSAWFLHDTLETNMEDCKKFYKTITPSSALGKSVSNTLCLNTHIWTLTVLRRFTDLCHEKHCEDMFKRGLTALKRALSLRPASVIYGPIYLLNDFLLGLSLKTENPLLQRMHRRYGRMLRRSVLGPLKKRFPRLVMPDGFVERDLSYSHLSYPYHLVNVKDMLLLYKQVREPWLLEIIEKSMRYTVRSGLAGHLALTSKRAAVFLHALCLYSETVGDRYEHLIPQYLDRFEALSLPLLPEVRSHPAVSGLIDSDNGPPGPIVTAKGG